MKKSIRQRLPEILFFCIVFLVSSLILRSHYSFFPGSLEKFFLKFGLHFSSWPAFYRSCAVLFADLLITVFIFLGGVYTCGIHKNSGNRNFVTICIPVIVSLVLLTILCELQIFRREDFWEVQYSKDLGLFKFIRQAMQTEGGRFFSYFLKGCSSFFRTVPGTMIYLNTCLFLSLAAMLAGMYRLILLLLSASASEDRPISDRKASLLFAFCFFAAFLLSTPKIWEDWFWDAGGLIFGIGVSLSLWAFALIAEDVLRDPGRQGRMILPSLVLIAACGCSQGTTIAIDILITELLIYVYISRCDGAVRRRVLSYFCIAAAASAVCLLAPGNFYRLETGSFDAPEAAAVTAVLSRFIPDIFRHVKANILMMKDYWLFLILICFVFGSLIRLRNGRKIMILSIGMIPAGFFSLSLNSVIDYWPARIYVSAFIWFALAAGLLAALVGASFHDLLEKSVFPVRIQASYIFLLVFASFSQIFFLYNENHHLLRDIRSAWFYRDEQIRAVSEPLDRPLEICGVPVIETNWTDIRYAEAFIANYYGLPGVVDSGVCPPFIPYSDDPAQWR